MRDAARRATRHRAVRAVGLFVVVVVCSASWWDPRTWMSDAIDGLMARRDRIVEHFDRLVLEKGERAVLYTHP